MSKHTPGPWSEVPPQNEGANSLRIFSGSKLVGLASNSDMSDDELEANARLIAAAPDLLEALRSARTFASIVEGDAAQQMCIHFDQVIRKAEGETQRNRFKPEGE